MRHQSFLLVCFLFVISFTQAQPFSKKYIMSFHSCDFNQCNGPQDHTVQLAESDDGTTWTMVPNFTSYSGSVPDVIIHNNKLYIYTPGVVKRYDYNTNTWDSGTTNVTILDSASNKVNFVDPSAIIDSAGNLVLVFMNSTGSTGDPAQCSTYPCTKYFDSAIEVSGSDGTSFVKQSGHRLALTLTNGSASDPDIYYNGSKYILYISKGSSTYAYYSSTLHGTYQALPNLSSGLLTNDGGIPCGHYDTTTQKYWTYVHASSGTTTEIKQKIHSDLNSSYTGSTTIISGTLMGFGSNYKTESPGFTENTFTASTSINKIYASNTIEMLYRNDEKIIDVRNMKGVNALEIYNVMGKKIYVENTLNKNTTSIHVNNFSAGIYFIQAITTTENKFVGKFIR